jgi:hypothetical protein
MPVCCFSGEANMITLNEMETMLDEIAETFPPQLFHGLNGGVSLLPETKLNPHGKYQDLFILGEYQFSHIYGRLIVIYYGSIIKAFGHLSREQMKERLSATLKHEFRHHLESLAGERDLEIEDEAFIDAYLNRFGK